MLCTASHVGGFLHRTLTGSDVQNCDHLEWIIMFLNSFERNLAWILRFLFIAFVELELERLSLRKGAVINDSIQKIKN